MPCKVIWWIYDCRNNCAFDLITMFMTNNSVPREHDTWRGSVVKPDVRKQKHTGSSVNSERLTQPADPTAVTKKDLRAEKYFPLSTIDGGPGVSSCRQRAEAAVCSRLRGYLGSQRKPCVLHRKCDLGDARLPEGRQQRDVCLVSPYVSAGVCRTVLCSLPAEKSGEAPSRSLGYHILHADKNLFSRLLFLDPTCWESPSTKEIMSDQRGRRQKHVSAPNVWCNQSPR